jgi:hypothetical protein
MKLLEQTEGSVRLECEHCHAHRVVPRATYNHARRWACSIRCVACTRMTYPEPRRRGAGSGALTSLRAWGSKVAHGWSHSPRPL